LAPAARVRLVTVSTPFAGIAAAADCGKPWLHALSLGVTAAVCRGIAGEAWNDLHENASLIQSPGTLAPQVAEVLEIRTDEAGACRRRDDAGTCVEDDFVFSLSEQRNPTVTRDHRVTVQRVEAGHVEIIGRPDRVSPKLVNLLEGAGLIAARTSEPLARPLRLALPETSGGEGAGVAARIAPR